MRGFELTQFLAGIAVFVYAMSLIEQSIRHLSGRAFKKFLQEQSDNRLKITLASAGTAAILQSSSVVVLTLLSFVGAGLIALTDALAAVLGANLGTTLTSWILAVVGFRIELQALAFPILALALLGLLLSKQKSTIWHVTRFLIGFAFIFISLDWLKHSLDLPIQSDIKALAGLHYLAFIPIGFLLTAIVQSSSATVAITLSAVHQQILPMEHAAALVIGSELGTTIKFLLGSIGGNADKKRVAWGNFIMNLITLFLAALLLRPLLFLVFNILGFHNHLNGLVMFQTIINLFILLLFYPFLTPFSRFLEHHVHRRSGKGQSLYLREQTAATVDDSLALANSEIHHLIRQTLILNKKVMGITEKHNGTWRESFLEATSDTYADDYARLKGLEGEILDYLAEIPREEMTPTDMVKAATMINMVRHASRSAKNLKDIQHNLNDFAESANDHLYNLYTKMRLQQIKLYETINQWIGEVPGSSAENIALILDENRKNYDAVISEVLEILQKNQVTQLDSSNLLNVYREIYSSNKALIKAIDELRDLQENGSNGTS